VGRLAEKSGGLVLPALPLGYSWTWRDIPGTVTLRFDTLLEVARDVAESLARNGVRALCVVTGHEANRGPLKYALRERIVDHVDLAVLNLFYPGMEQILEEADSEAWHAGILHADEVETSMLLATHPELVHMDRAVRDYPAPPETYGLTRVTMGDLMASGVFGDATVAEAGKGRRWLELSTDEAARLWRTFLIEHDIPGAP
jgi:creatinine amidohydrolase